MLNVNIAHPAAVLGDFVDAFRPNDRGIVQSYRELPKAQQKFLQNALKVFANITGMGGAVVVSNISKVIRYGLRLSDYVEHGPPSVSTGDLTGLNAHAAVKHIACATMAVAKFVATPLKLVKSLQSLGWMHQNAINSLPAGLKQACTSLTKLNISLLLIISGLDLIELYRSGKRETLKVVERVAYFVGASCFLAGVTPAATVLLTSALVLEMTSAWRTVYPSQPKVGLQHG